MFTALADEKVFVFGAFVCYDVEMLQRLLPW